MWALDLINDVLLLSLLPSVVVLVGTVLLLMLYWSVMAIALAYGALTVTLVTRVVALAARRSHARDTRIGGILSDALSAN